MERKQRKTVRVTVEKIADMARLALIAVQIVRVLIDFLHKR